MIRVKLEDGQVAMFDECETIIVCRRIIDGEYIVGEENIEAGDFADLFSDGDTDCEYVFFAGQFHRVASVYRTVV